MGSAGFILGGLLSGAGQGLAQDIENRRQMALQQLRGQQAAESDARQMQAAEARDDRKFVRDRSLLATGSALKIAEDTAQSGNRIKEAGVKGQIDIKLQGQKIAGERGLATLKGEIDTRIQAAKGQIDRGLIEAKAQIESGQVDSVQQTADGRYFIVRKDGSTLTTQKVGAPPGQKDEESPIARRAGGKPAATPTAAATPPVANPFDDGKSAVAPAGKPVLSKGEYQNALNGASRKRAKGEAGWKGLSDAELRKKLADIYDAAGYGLPSV